MEGQNMYEYVVSPAKQPIWRLRRVLAILGYLVYAGGVFAVGVMSKLLVPMMALVPLSTWILVYFTWRYVAVEYEYSFVSGSMTLTKILGGRARKKVLEVRIKELHMIAPYDGDYIKQAEAFKPEKSYDFVSSMQTPDLYFALLETSEGRRGIIYFEATKPALKILRYYNTDTVIAEVRY
jgi:hypothetical protein